MITEVIEISSLDYYNHTGAIGDQMPALFSMVEIEFSDNAHVNNEERQDTKIKAFSLNAYSRIFSKIRMKNTHYLNIFAEILKAYISKNKE